ncbi:MAG: RsbRD N-terminal domain-containing protein [Deltaproteobacteria bacterium]|nr:RsbRD N-terminal domain-containing protein [Deltaproteobacteria bacterium]
MTSVAAIIHRHQDEIMKGWLAEARIAASARGLSAVALEDVVPLYLSALADQFETGQVDASERRRKHVESHLSSRLRQGFDLAEILEEFVLLGQCIAKRWQSLPKHEWPSVEDIERLHMQIHVAITEVTDAFHRHMLEDEQSEKRYLRRLEEIASTALHDTERPLEERLRELLDVVKEAMSAHSADLLVYGLAEGELVSITGAVTEPHEPRQATSGEQSSFIGEIAAHEAPTPIYDASSTRLEVPDALRRSGLRSLLGVRLPPRGKLLGVMYVGVSETREFTSRELRRMESLAERVGLHLENARLFAELHHRIEALDVERAMRERFVSTLAHDLRGPLSAARLAATLLAREPTSLDDRRDLATKIDHNIDRVDRMIRDLLDANRIRAGEPLPLRLDTCDLTALAAQVAEEARVMYGDRFELELEAPVRGIWSADELHRALWNLVTNAVKYGAARAPITIAVKRHEDGARVSVHNAGRPIPIGDQTHIFNAYVRAPAADAGGRTGWGLGLTIVRGVAEAHGGRVSLTSEAASGTTFAIDLPFDSRSARSHADARAAAP